MTPCENPDRFTNNRPAQRTENCNDLSPFSLLQVTNWKIHFNHMPNTKSKNTHKTLPSTLLRCLQEASVFSITAEFHRTHPSWCGSQKTGVNQLCLAPAVWRLGEVMWWCCRDVAGLKDMPEIEELQASEPTGRSVWAQLLNLHFPLLWSALWLAFHFLHPLAFVVINLQESPSALSQTVPLPWPSCVNKLPLCPVHLSAS